MNKKVPTNQEIEKICKAYLKEYWNEELVIPVKIDGRLKKSFGYFKHDGKLPGCKSSMIEIKFSKDLFLYYNDYTIKGVILHELTHYVLYKKGYQDYYDGGYSFEKELKRVGSHSTNTVYRKGEYYTVYCPNCGKIVLETYSKRKVTNMINNYICRCNSYLKVKSETIIQDEKENCNYK